MQSVSGKYEGVFKGDGIGNLPATMTLKHEGGNISGSVDTPNGPAPITTGTYAEEKLMMTLDVVGSEWTITARLDGDRISGEWELVGQTGTLELNREE